MEEQWKKIRFTFQKPFQYLSVVDVGMATEKKRASTGTISIGKKSESNCRLQIQM